MLKKITLTILLLTCAFADSTRAQTDAAAEKRLVVREFYKLMNPDANTIDLNNLINVQAEETGKTLVAFVSSEYRQLSAEQLKTLNDIVLKNQKEISKRLRDKLTPQFNFDKYVDEVFEAFYDEYFTLDEIKTAPVFHKTSAGKKMFTMTKALNAYVKQKLIGEFMKAMWKADENIKTGLKQETALKFKEEMLKGKNPPDKKQ